MNTNTAEKTVPLTIRLAPSVKNKIKVEANQLGISMSTYVTLKTIGCDLSVPKSLLNAVVEYVG